jgi:hypothetical protein
MSRGKGLASFIGNVTQNLLNKVQSRQSTQAEGGGTSTPAERNKDTGSPGGGGGGGGGGGSGGEPYQATIDKYATLKEEAEATKNEIERLNEQIKNTDN